MSQSNRTGQNNSGSLIPQQLRGYSLIRVCRPNCMVSSHGDCNSPGKRPVTSVENVQIVREVRRWIKNGGNYGIVPQSDDDLVIIDSDTQQFSVLVEDSLPETFTVRTGGGGRHYYFKVPSYTENGEWTEPKGSVRSKNWHAVGPGSNHKAGGKYRVLHSVPIAEIEPADMDSFTGLVDSFKPGREGVQSGGGGGSAQFTIPDSLDFIQRDDLRSDVAEILQSSDVEHSRRLWMVGFLYSVCGLRKNEIVDLIMSEASWSKLDRQITEKQVDSVISSSRNGRGTHPSEFSGTADMDLDRSERRKTESGAVNPEFEGGEHQMVEFNDKLEVPILEGSEPGDSFKKAVLVEGKDNGETFEYVALKKGNVQEANTTDGEEVLVENVDDSVSLGAPDYLPELVDGLETLNEQLEG